MKIEKTLLEEVNKLIKSKSSSYSSDDYEGLEKIKSILENTISEGRCITESEFAMICDSLKVFFILLEMWLKNK